MKSGDNRLFRRLMTVYGMCRRPHLITPAVEALRELPELRVLQKCLRYLSQQDYARHEGITHTLLSMVRQDQLLFPYQVGKVFETLKFLHPANPKMLASQIRQLGCAKSRHWYVRQKSAEALLTFPYREDWIDGISDTLLHDEHPWVRRAGCALLTRGSVKAVKAKLKRLIYHPDLSVNRLAQFWHRHVEDNQFAMQQVARLAAGQPSDTGFVHQIPVLYVLRCNPDKLVIERLREYLSKHSKTKSSKIHWHLDTLSAQTAWVEFPLAAAQTNRQAPSRAA
jgi:hypothetical protein